MESRAIKFFELTPSKISANHPFVEYNVLAFIIDLHAKKSRAFNMFSLNVDRTKKETVMLTSPFPVACMQSRLIEKLSRARRPERRCALPSNRVIIYTPSYH